MNNSDTIPNNHHDGVENNIAKGKKRVRHDDNNKKAKRRTQRNAGKEYVTSKGKVIFSKSFFNIICGCVKHCNDSIEEIDRNGLFSRFWDLKDFSKQNAYISGLVQRVLVKQRRPNALAEVPKGPKSVTYKYVVNIRKESIVVCKKYFMDTFQISNGRLQRLLKKEEMGKPPGEDLRGKKECPKKTSDDALKVVKEHIESFPRYDSHYTRAHNPNRKYLHPELNIKKLYNLYVKYCEDKDVPPEKVVKEHIYRDVFNKEFNLSFHSPRKDTCAKCDKYKIQVSITPNGPQKDELEAQHQLHLRRAEKSRTSLKEDTELSRELDDTLVFTFDLEKALAFPKLTVSNAYYKRNMYVYNLGIHHTTTSQAFMYTWNETVASRGSQEIGSCIIKHIELHCANVNHIIAYSDACTGQNRNIKLSLIWKTIVENPENHITKIDHKFMVSGHSYLPNDRDFGLIERAAKLSALIYTPSDWVRIIRDARKNKFQVYEMQRENFFSTQNLEKQITKRKLNTNKMPFKWLQVQWLRFDNTPNVIFYKESLSNILEFSSLDLKKSGKGRPRTSFPKMHQLLYSTPRPVTAAKKKDMLELLQWIPPIQHQFFTDLLTAEDAVEIGPFSDVEEEAD